MSDEEPICPRCGHEDADAAFALRVLKERNELLAMVGRLVDATLLAMEKIEQVRDPDLDYPDTTECDSAIDAARELLRRARKD